MRCSAPCSRTIWGKAPPFWPPPSRPGCCPPCAKPWLWVLKTLCSGVLVAGLAGLLPAVPELFLKIPVDCALFFANYLAQKKFVY